MHAERPAKAAIRALWVEVVRRRKAELPQSVPFYLTLPGAAGLDLKLLIEEGLIESTESGAIAEADNMRVIAVEKDSMAVLELQLNFLGLKIIENDFYNGLHGFSQIAFPSGRDRATFTAGVINLDLNDPIVYKNGLFPVIEAVVKIASLQAAATPRHDWTLLLTAQGEISWPQEVQEAAQRFLDEQCRLCPEFDTGCKRLFGDPLYGQVRNEEPFEMTSCQTVEQQMLLMAFIPAKLASRVYNTGWRVDTVRILHYGGELGAAPMVTWILDFCWDHRASSTPNEVLMAALRRALDGVGYVTAEGDLVDL
jgi:hypothetical protein